MGRVAVIEMLGADSRINELGIDQEDIWPNFALDRSPRRAGPWLVLRWGPVALRFNGEAQRRNLTIWAYQSRQEGTDYAQIDALLEAVRKAMSDAVHYLGSDGSILHMADVLDYSGDLVDNGYDAITRNVSFNVLTAEPV